MKNIHVRFEYEEALDAKKELLYSQLSILEFLRKFKNYKSLRNRELILKGKLKTGLASLRTEVARLEETFPEEKEEEIKLIEKTVRKKHKEIKGQENIERQLQEIKEKLAALG